MLPPHTSSSTAAASASCTPSGPNCSHDETRAVCGHACRHRRKGCWLGARFSRSGYYCAEIWMKTVPTFR
ncbi:unnamed protein product [Urochloa humidicola]